MAMGDHDPGDVINPGDDAGINRRIKDTERKFRVLFNNPRDVIWLMDLKTWRFLYVSREIKDILGYEPEEFEDKTPRDICTPECVNEVLPVFEKKWPTLQTVHRKKPCTPPPNS